MILGRGLNGVIHLQLYRTGNQSPVRRGVNIETKGTLIMEGKSLYIPFIFALLHLAFEIAILINMLVGDEYTLWIFFILRVEYYLYCSFLLSVIFGVTAIVLAVRLRKKSRKMCLINLFSFVAHCQYLLFFIRFLTIQ